MVECDGNPDVILVASGSEVSTLFEGAKLLRADGVKICLVSLLLSRLFPQTFNQQNTRKAYCHAMLKSSFAGLPVNLLGLVGANGKIWGLESFGFSAPYTVLDEKLGFNGKNVYEQVKKCFRKIKKRWRSKRQVNCLPIYFLPLFCYFPNTLFLLSTIHVRCDSSESTQERPPRVGCSSRPVALCWDSGRPHPVARLQCRQSAVQILYFTKPIRRRICNQTGSSARPISAISYYF